MEAAVDWREVNQILGTHFRVGLVGGIQQLIHILCQLQVAVALCLGEGRMGGGYVEINFKMEGPGCCGTVPGKGGGRGLHGRKIGKEGREKKREKVAGGEREGHVGRRARKTQWEQKC